MSTRRAPTGRLLQSDLPLAAAPMAGGPTTPDLVAAVSEAGAFGFLAAGYKTPQAMAEEITRVRATGHPFGVNLFVPGTGSVDRDALRAYAARLAPDAERYGVDLDPEPVVDDDHWRDKIDLLLADPVPVVSFTFGLPDAADLRALRRAGSRVLASVTTPDEARRAEEAGVDGLVVQGASAGGHSATYDPARAITDEPTTDVVARVRAETALPVVAAGGVDGPDAVRDLLAAGAETVAVGTLLLRSPEAGTSPTHRAAIADAAFTATVITHAFTGRPARGLLNDFIERHEAHAPLGYPSLHHLTRPIRQAAAKAGDPQAVHLWAGTGFRQAEEAPAATIVRRLAGEPMTGSA